MRADDLVERPRDLFGPEAAAKHLRREQTDRDRERPGGEDFEHAVTVVVHRDVEVLSVERNPPRPSGELARTVDLALSDHGRGGRGSRSGLGLRRLGSLLLLLGLRRVERREDLALAAAVAVVGDRLDTELPREPVDAVRVLDRGVRRRVDRLRDRVVDVLLARGQHAEMIVGRERQRVDEVFRQLVAVLHDVRRGLLDRVVVGRIELDAERARRDRVRVGPLADRVATVVGVGEVRLDARGGLGAERDRARRSDGRDLVVARRELDRAVDANLVVDELLVEIAVRLELGHRPLLGAERERFEPRLLANERHESVGERGRLLRAVDDPLVEQQIREAHDAEPDRARALDRVVDLRQRPVAHVDDVVEESHRRADVGSELLPVEIVGRLVVVLGQVDRAEVAGVEVVQHLFAARVRRALRPHRVPQRVRAVHVVDEDDPRLGPAVRARDDPAPDVGREDHARARRLLAVVGVGTALAVIGLGIVDRLGPRLAVELQLIPVAVLDRGEEVVRHRHRDVEVRQRPLVVLRVDEPQDVRVLARHDAHVGATAHTALLDGLGHRVDDLHEGDRARRDSAAAADARARGPQQLVGHSRAAARLVDERAPARMLHDLGEVVSDRKHEARGKLPLRLARVHQTRRVGKESAVQHQRHHRLDELAPLDRVCLGLCDVADDAHTDVIPLFDGTPHLVLEGIPLRNDAPRIQTYLCAGARPAVSSLLRCAHRSTSHVPHLMIVLPESVTPLALARLDRSSHAKTLPPPTSSPPKLRRSWLGVYKLIGLDVLAAVTQLGPLTNGLECSPRGSGKSIGKSTRYSGPS